MQTQKIALISQIQAQLTLLGYKLNYQPGIYCPNTILAVKKFQSTHCDQYGNPLTIDGIAGSLTLSTLLPKSLAQVSNLCSSQKSTSLQIHALEYAIHEIGIRENPPASNRGARVEQYLKSVNRQPGDAWCAAFVYWCFQQAANQLQIPNPLPQTGSCLTHWNKTTGTKIPAVRRSVPLRLNSQIQPGSIFILDLGHGHGHTGIVTSVQNGYINTIEGNTNITHTSEGLGVFELTRKISSINAGFINY